MKSSIQLDHNSMTFETDCLQLVNILEEDEEDKWPSLLAELDEFHFISSMFSFYSISFIPRSLNFRANRLAKGARSRGISFSHVNTQLPSWMVHEANLLVSWQFLNKIWSFRWKKKKTNSAIANKIHSTKFQFINAIQQMHLVGLNQDWQKQNRLIITKSFWPSVKRVPDEIFVLGSIHLGHLVLPFRC